MRRDNWTDEQRANYNRNYYAVHREKRKAHSKAYYHANKIKVQEYKKVHHAQNRLSVRSRRLLMTYGMTVEMYDMMVAKQKGLCAICNKPETRSINGVICGLAVDHCHVTKKIRSLLCTRCNTAIGLLQEDPSACEAAASYLRRHLVVL